MNRGGEVIGKGNENGLASEEDVCLSADIGLGTPGTQAGDRTERSDGDDE
jgi:hypothetical protein